jgi:hypothetical protein
MERAIPSSRGCWRGSRCSPVLRFLVVVAVATTWCPSVPAAAGEQAETATYEFFLLRSDGRPAANAVVRVMGDESEMPPATADDLGRVKIEGLIPGDPAFFLASSADGREKMFTPVLVVPEGTERVTLRLYPPGAVRGELLDETGKPASGITVGVSGWEWLYESGAPGSSVTNEVGRFEIGGLVAGAYYTVNASEELAPGPGRTWRSSPFRTVGWDGWYDVGILLPEGQECEPDRLEGEVVASIASGLDDKWFDLHNREWRPAVETYDPNRAWTPAPEGATWIWRAGRPDPSSERYGATVEFRKLFSVGPREREIVGYLTIAADDYAAVRLNGQWVGQTNEYLCTVSMVVPSEFIHAGQNELRITVRNIPSIRRDFYNPTGVAYRLELIEVPE